jgi:hypothetical protein
MFPVMADPSRLSGAGPDQSDLWQAVSAIFMHKILPGMVLTFRQFDLFVVNVELDDVFNGFQALNLGFAQPVFDCLLPFISYSQYSLVDVKAVEQGQRKRYENMSTHT